jgi:hypothetical protein
MLVTFETFERDKLNKVPLPNKQNFLSQENLQDSFAQSVLRIWSKGFSISAWNSSWHIYANNSKRKGESQIWEKKKKKKRYTSP